MLVIDFLLTVITLFPSSTAFGCTTKRGGAPPPIVDEIGLQVQSGVVQVKFDPALYNKELSYEFNITSYINRVVERGLEFATATPFVE